MVVVKINDKILLYIFGYFGLYTFGSCIPLGLVYLWLVYLWLCIPLGDIPPRRTLEKNVACPPPPLSPLFTWARIAPYGPSYDAFRDSSG